jgi:hypothetical protein
VQIWWVSEGTIAAENHQQVRRTVRAEAIGVEQERSDSIAQLATLFVD